MEEYIYPAYRLETRDPEEMERLMGRLKSALEAKATELTLREVARRAVLHVDNYLLGRARPAPDAVPVQLAWSEFLTEARGAADRRTRRSRSDMTFSLTLYRHRGHFYVILHEPRREFVEIFERSIPCCDYSYWKGGGNTAGKDTTAHHSERGRVWSAVLLGDVTAGAQRARLTLLGVPEQLSPATLEMIDAYLPDHQTRIKQQTRSEALQLLLENGAKDDSAKGVGRDPHEVVERIMNASARIDLCTSGTTETEAICRMARERVVAALYIDPGPLIRLTFAEIRRHSCNRGHDILR